MTASSESGCSAAVLQGAYAVMGHSRGSSEAEVSVSTVSSNVSNNVSNYDQPVPAQGSVSRWRLLWWRHGGSLATLLLLLLLATGLGLLLAGLLLPLRGLRLAAAPVLGLGLLLLVMKAVIFFTGADQRAAGTPYTGFNTRAPGVSWAKVWAK